jgi:hypothetical protein
MASPSPTLLRQPRQAATAAIDSGGKKQRIGKIAVKMVNMLLTPRGRS